MTNFATYIDTTNDKAPIAQRGKAKQKRTDLRLVGLGMVVTRTGGIPLVWHAYPGNRPDVTQFPTLIDHLVRHYTAATQHSTAPRRQPGGAGGGSGGGGNPAAMTVIFDAGQNSAANFAHLTGDRAAFRRIRPAQRLPGPARATRVPPHDRRRRPLPRPHRDRHPPRRLRHRPAGRAHPLPNLHDDQARSFTDTTLTKVGRQLDELAATLARGKTRRTRDQVTTEIGKITHDSPGSVQVIDWDLHRRHPRRAPTHLDHQRHEAGKRWKHGCSANGS